MLERTAAQSAALAEELRNVARQAEKLIGALSADKDEAVLELRGRVAASIAQARRKLDQLESYARRIGSQAGAATDVYVNENPWTTLGIAAAAGLMLGACLGAAGLPLAGTSRSSSLR